MEYIQGTPREQHPRVIRIVFAAVAGLKSKHIVTWNLYGSYGN